MSKLNLNIYLNLNINGLIWYFNIFHVFLQNDISLAFALPSLYLFLVLLCRLTKTSYYDASLTNDGQKKL